MEETKERYYAQVHLWGRLTLALSMVAFLGIGIYLSYGMHLHPGWENVTAAFLGIAAIIGYLWFNISDQIMYLLLIGPAATYMAMMTGNIKSMRLPAAMAACAEVEDENRMKRDILATYGVAVSVVVNTTFLIILAFAGKAVLDILPTAVLQGMNHIVPALFGAIFAQFAIKRPRAAVISLAVVIVVYQMGFIPAYLKTFSAIVVSIAANILFQQRKQKRAEVPETDK